MKNETKLTDAVVGAAPLNSNGGDYSGAQGLVSAVVLSTVGDQVAGEDVVRVYVNGQSLPFEARLAAACLLRPETGDRVLLVHADTASGWWVLSVLQRGQSAAPAVLNVPGAAELHLLAPSLRLTAQSKLSVAATEVQMDAAQATVHAGVLRLVASAAHVVAQRMTRVAQAFHSLTDTVSEHCRTRSAVVDEVDSTQAGIGLMESREAMLLKGGQVLMEAKETMRVDGTHILMG